MFHQISEKEEKKKEIITICDFRFCCEPQDFLGKKNIIINNIFGKKNNNNKTCSFFSLANNLLHYWFAEALILSLCPNLYYVQVSIV